MVGTTFICRPSVGMHMAPRYVAGFDGGATKTNAMIATEDGNVLSLATSGPSNYHVVGLKGAGESILNSFQEAAKKAGLRKKKVDVAIAGLAGLDCGYDERVLSSALTGLGLADQFKVVHDTTIALYGATGGQAGVIVIAGTGSVAAGMDGKGAAFRVGGWGPTLGDEGSGYEIGRKALSAAMMAFDGRLPRTELEEEIRRALRLDSTDGIMMKVYGERMSVTQIAALAPIVTELAKKGDQVASNIVRETVESLASLAKATIVRTGLKNRTFPLATIGGVFRAGDVIVRPFTLSVMLEAPGAMIGKPRMGPALGSVLAALEIAKGGLTQEIIDKVEQTGREIETTG